MSNDRLRIQVSFKIRKPKGVRITKAVYQELLQRVIDGKKLPKNVTLRGIFWQNPNRPGEAAAWRYHHGADLSMAPDGPIETTARGSLRHAIGTLFHGRLPLGEVSF